MAKKKPSYLQRKQKDTVNIKAMLWVGSILVGIIIIISILIVLNN